MAEPPLNLSVSVLFALRQAINSAREDLGNYEWYEMGKKLLFDDGNVKHLQTKIFLH